MWPEYWKCEKCKGLISTDGEEPNIDCSFCRNREWKVIRFDGENNE